MEQLSAAGMEEIVVVLGHEANKIKAILQNNKVTFIENDSYLKGMTSTIQMGVSIANGAGYMICLSDMFLIEADEYAIMKEFFEKQIVVNSKTICLPVYNSKKGNPVIFSSFYKNAILDHKNPEGCKEIVTENKENISFIQMRSDHILKDADTIEDYNKIIEGV